MAESQSRDTVLEGHSSDRIISRTILSISTLLFLTGVIELFLYGNHWLYWARLVMAAAILFMHFLHWQS